MKNCKLTPPFPAEIVDPEARGQFFYFLSFLVLVLAFVFGKVAVTVIFLVLHELNTIIKRRYRSCLFIQFPFQYFLI